MGGAWKQLWQRLYSDEWRQKHLANAGLVDWNGNYADVRVNNKLVTRLGDGTVDIEVDLTSPFDGSRIRKIPVPVRWLNELPNTVNIISSGDKFAIGDRCFLYDQTGLSQAKRLA